MPPEDGTTPDGITSGVATKHARNNDNATPRHRQPTGPLEASEANFVHDVSGVDDHESPELQHLTDDWLLAVGRYSHATRRAVVADRAFSEVASGFRGDPKEERRQPVLSAVSEYVKALADLKVARADVLTSALAITRHVVGPHLADVICQIVGGDPRD